MARNDVAMGLATALGLLIATLPLASDTPGAHDGQVVAYGTGLPVGALVGAWKQDSQTDMHGNCPAFGEAIDSQRADEKGNFTLKVGDERSFTVSFCADGYFPQALPDLPNDAATDIVPRPVTMLPSGPVDPAAFDRQVRTAALGAVYQLAYLASIDPEQYYAALDRLVGDIGAVNPERAVALQTLGRIAETWIAVRPEKRSVSEVTLPPDSRRTASLD